MTLRPYSKFIVKSLLLSFPFLFALTCYVIRDPFMVLRQYDDYDHSPICQNEGYVAWQKYKLYRHKAHYDAFLMGNSCTKAFSCDTWNSYVHGHPFRLFCNNLGLADLCQVLDALDRQPHQPVRHILLVTDRTFFMKQCVSCGAMHVMPPDVSHDSWLTVQTEFAKAFFGTDVLGPYLRYLVTGKSGPWSEGVVCTATTRTTISNEAVVDFMEDSIKRMGEAYWRDKRFSKVLHAQPKTDVQIIFQPQLRLLCKVRDFCRKHHTDLRLVIGPTTERLRMNPADVTCLCRILGKANVYDYTDRQDLNNIHNFYDTAHYRIGIGNLILKDIYGNGTTASTHGEGPSMIPSKGGGNAARS